MRRGACISLLPLAGHVIISAMNALPTPPHSFGVRMCRIARGGFPRPWALHKDADRPYSSNPPIRQTQRSLLGRTGRAAAGGFLHSIVLGYAPHSIAPHPIHRGRIHPHVSAHIAATTMLGKWVDDVASALRLRRAPLLPLSSSDRPRSRIRWGACVRLDF